MYRITKAYENEKLSIYCIEGKVTDEVTDNWMEEMSRLKDFQDHEIILDLSQLWYLSSRAAEVLMNSLQNNLFLLNCPLPVRNVLHVSGLSSRTLN